MTKYTVVVPIYNNWTLTHQLLFDLYKVLPTDVEIIIADDCSPDKDVEDGLIWWSGSMLKGRLQVARPDTNLGFLRNVNYAVSCVTSEIVILLNNDIRVYENPIPSIEDALLRHKDIPVLMGTSLQSGDTGWNKFGDVIFPYLEGWFLAFRKSDWDKFGGFDERYIPADFEDVDLSTNFLEKGGLLVDLDIRTHHIGGQSIGYSLDRERQTKINQEKFKNKWISKQSE